MDRLIYTAFSGLNASMVRQRVIAANMANTQTIGYREDTLQFTPMTVKGDSMEVRALSDGEVRGANMAEGSLTETGRMLDIAMVGKAMLTVQGQDGQEAYTRRGDLSISPSGVLENGDGRPVIGENGPISIPPGGQVSIGPDGQVLVRDPATPNAPPNRVDRLKLATPNGTRIEKGLDGLFRVYGGGALPNDLEARVLPGSLEQSNVKPSEVLVQMVEAQRLFDIRTKLISTAKDVDQSSSALMRLT
ncbi:flagellar basal body rod protein FlgF [Novosphingobium aerophilum]|uniref:Flagellar basal-body rod protein FlgF n=1 Tax=Novosphingobium aerophilum TaxID=2839843 RepID=A0A7X1KCI8_9SPHN|nr:flagellar basal body rod protein FlgF [Novosphingobium aerophilum]MBC2652162.1 flagellar basal body rod protein FlgF [Novosphingobium aerophilum]